ncbi:LamG domain-containing protein [Candidatus Poribacteria bacterium]|nr:LamG domain-containing protein [Candidatus Poribacteria bacterium]MYA99562.1 LamG domain-containing protein [Candidatus Poribacteria bacterium]
MLSRSFYIEYGIVQMIQILPTITLILCLGVSSFAAFEENTVLLYLFDEEVANEATDLSEFKNHGEATDTEWTKDGKRGGALIFDGANSLIEVPHHDSLHAGSDEVTIEAWFKPTTFPAGHPPIARKGAVGDSGWGLDTPGGKVRGFIYNAPGNFAVADGATQMQLDTWHHLAMVYDGKEVRVYLDGELDAKVARGGDLHQNEASVWIGKKAIESIWLDGTLDELRILNIAVTQEQIRKDMEGIALTVEVTGKLTTTWGRIKSEVRR